MMTSTSSSGIPSLLSSSSSGIRIWPTGVGRVCESHARQRGSSTIPGASGSLSGARVDSVASQVIVGGSRGEDATREGTVGDGAPESDGDSGAGCVELQRGSSSGSSSGSGEGTELSDDVSQSTGDVARASSEGIVGVGPDERSGDGSWIACGYP